MVSKKSMIDNYDEEAKEIIARGFGSRSAPNHLKHSALQELANEKHSKGQMLVMGEVLGEGREHTIMGQKLYQSKKPLGKM